MKVHADQCRYLLGRSEHILTGLDESHRGLEPAPGMKTAGWLIGPLAVTGDFARQLCGPTASCPAEWRAAFYPGTLPSTTADDYPPMSTLIATFRSVYEDLCTAAREAGPGALAAENPYAPARTGFPTAGEFVAYLLTGRLAYHLGQLVAWRAAAGLDSVHRSDPQAAERSSRARAWGVASPSPAQTLSEPDDTYPSKGVGP